jgi:very-short-patch-repair endonuclease
VNVENVSDAVVPPGATASPQVLAQRDAWVNRLMDFSRRNRLIYYRDRKRGTLYVSSDLASDSIGKLVAGDTCPLSDFFPDGVTQTENAIAKEIRAVAKSNEEERGLQTLFVGLGFANWDASDDGSPANAPMFLMPVSITSNDRTGQISLKRAGDLILNRVMLGKLEEEYKIRVDTSFFDDGEARENIAALYLHLTQIELSAAPGFSSSPKCVLGNFDYQKMAMVEDLRNHEDLLIDNDLVAAIAGDETARASIAASQRSVEAQELDQIPPRDEPFVLGADGSQQIVLHSAIRHAAHSVVLGPPGTGKSQTISNLIAALIAQGKRVLFVAEKRAALEVVYKRLDQVGLGHLVLDLHGGDVKRKTIYERLQKSDEIARNAPIVDGDEEEAQFEKARTALNNYERALHRRQPGLNISAFDAFSRLAALKAIEVRTRWRGEAIKAFSEERLAEAIERVGFLSAHVELTRREPGVPWSQATFTTTDGASAALVVLSELQRALGTLRIEWSQLVASAAPSVSSIAEIRAAVPRLETLDAAIATFGSAVCELDLNVFDAALAPARGRFFERLFAWFSSSFRQRCKQLRALNPRGWPGATQAAVRVHSFAEMPSDWRSQGLAKRVEAYGVTNVLLAARTTLQKHQELSHTLGIELPGPLNDLAAALDTLDRQSRNASIIPAIRASETRLRELDCAAFLDEITDRHAEQSTWQRMLQKAWLESALEGIIADEEALAAFKAEAHDRTVETFRRLDQRRIDLMAKRIRRVAAERYIQAMNQYPQQRAAVRLELQKKIRHMPLRKLMLTAPEVLSAICPCYMASPLSVSQLLPAEVLFDVVIFDEGSQVLPEDAVPAIVRGKHTIIAGDPRQLPPTMFFAASERDDDDDDEDLATAGIESILELLTPFVEPRPLTWHYRSNDERLIAFSNTHIYGDRLLTLPSTGEEGAAIVHEYVSPQLVDGQEASAPAEVQRVVELILRHAEARPDESLGVIAMGIKHARRIEEALAVARADRPDLDEFFAEDREDRFFVKNLERVQGDERDAIVLSIGYGPDRSGKMVYRFGPINQVGGERRLNVAITRARNRMTVVSSFRHGDLDPERLRSQGAKLLGAFVQYAETGGANLGREGADTAVELNDFEQDVKDALTDRGLEILGQYGVSNYRIDLAVKHPEHPGQFVLAIECDGAAYHSAPTARNRDRLRQQHLEALGWRFHRIWSTEWFYEREAEIERVIARYEQCLKGKPEERTTPGVDSRDTPSALTSPPSRPFRKPQMSKRLPIDEYRSYDFHRLIAWIESDALLRTDDELVDELVSELGYSRRGHRIVERLRLEIATYREGARSNVVRRSGRGGPFRTM